MKKSLLILPLTALILAGCTTGGKGGSKKKKSSSGAEISSTSRKSGPVGPSAESATSVNPGPDTYQGYKKVLTAPENDKEYIYGIYQANLDKMIFLNGDHHRDDKGEYPYYLTTSGDPTKAVKIQCHYTDATHFTIKIVGGGEYQTHDGQYLSVYEGQKSDGTKVTSLQASATQGSWYFLESYEYKSETFTVKTNVMDLASEGYASQPVTMATYEEYETFSACTPNHFADNFISHLWEKE